ncbi:twin-arginine translocation signal domain-containing protein [Anaerolineales bacterium HSG6]|nr:twin-arginine translocation signal domain-containing protein [Anaerolineales bacterium HSG6]MDM8530273.1 twin-arginine translocation signal domain-containing protein [Anaerolineales bacterium HSG25]
MEKQNNIVSTEETKLGRRDLLKALAATSGAVVAASVLPGRWTQPIIESGVLPAHAQGSVVTITFTPGASTTYVYTVTTPSGVTKDFTTSYVTMDIESGTYRVTARFTGDVNASPAPRPRVDVSTSTGGSKTLAPTFDNTSAVDTAQELGVYP